MLTSVYFSLKVEPSRRSKSAGEEPVVEVAAAAEVSSLGPTALSLG